MLQLVVDWGRSRTGAPGDKLKEALVKSRYGTDLLPKVCRTIHPKRCRAALATALLCGCQAQLSNREAVSFCSNDSSAT
jgi:hypothetical protein